MGSGVMGRLGGWSGGGAALTTRLRVQDDRQVPLAAGAVLLAIAALAIDVRMTQWSLGPRFLVMAVISLLILALGWAVPVAGSVARPYQSVLMIAGLLVLIFALELFAEVLGAHRSPGSGGQFWIFAVDAGVAAAAARRAGSAGCTLVAALAAAFSFLALISWAFHPHAFNTFRWILLLETLVLAVGAVRLRPNHHRHAVQLVNAAGLLALLLSFTFLAGALIGLAQARLGTTSTLAGVGPAGFGWKLYVLLVTGALIGYSVMDREPAPGVLGVVLAAMFALLVGIHGLGGGSLVFWPLFLLILGGIGVAYGLRPGSTGPAAGTTPPAEPPGAATTSVPPPDTA